MQLQGKRHSQTLLGVGCKLEQPLQRTFWQYLWESTSFGSTIPRFGIYPTDLFAHEQITQVSDYWLQLVYNSKRVETAHPSIGRRLLRWTISTTECTCRCRRKRRKFSGYWYGRVTQIYIWEKGRSKYQKTGHHLCSQKWRGCMYVYVDILKWVYRCLKWFIRFLKGRGDGDLSLFILLQVLKFKLRECITYNDDNNNKIKKTWGSILLQSFLQSISIIRGALPLTDTQSSSWKYIVFL